MVYLLDTIVNNTVLVTAATKPVENTQNISSVLLIRWYIKKKVFIYWVKFPGACYGRCPHRLTGFRIMNLNSVWAVLLPRVCCFSF